MQKGLSTPAVAHSEEGRGASRVLEEDAPGGPFELDGVCAAAERRDWRGCLEGVLRAWRATRDVRLARLASALTDVLVVPYGAIPTGPTLNAFRNGLDSADAVERGVRIRAAGHSKKKAMAEALGEGVRGPLDPRWVDLVLPWFDAVPWRDATALWVTVLALADRTLDPRLEAALDRLRFVAPLPMGAISGHWIRAWMDRHPEGDLTRRRAEAAVLTDADLEQIDRVVQILALAQSEVDEAEASVAALYGRAAAGDDAALLVLADHWAAANDIRGTFVPLALRTDRGAQAAARKLERTAWRALLGPLAPVVLKRGLVFERGLPVAVVASSRKAAAIDAVRNRMEWASVRSLQLVPPAGRPEAVLDLLTPAQTRLEEVRVTATPASLGRLLFDGPAMPSVRRIEVVAPWTGPGGGRVDLGRCRFPNLEGIVLPPDWEAQLRSRLQTALPRVAFRLARL